MWLYNIACMLCSLAIECTSFHLFPSRSQCEVRYLPSYSCRFKENILRFVFPSFVIPLKPVSLQFIKHFNELLIVTNMRIFFDWTGKLYKLGFRLLAFLDCLTGVMFLNWLFLASLLEVFNLPIKKNIYIYFFCWFTLGGDLWNSYIE